MGVSIVSKSCMRVWGSRGRISNQTLYSTSRTLPWTHKQDVEKLDSSASVEAEVDASVSTAMSSYSRLTRSQQQVFCIIHIAALCFMPKLMPHSLWLLAGHRIEALSAVWAQDTKLPPRMLLENRSLHAPPLLDQCRIFRLLLQLLQAKRVFRETCSLL